MTPELLTLPALLTWIILVERRLTRLETLICQLRKEINNDYKQPNQTTKTSDLCSKPR